MALHQPLEILVDTDVRVTSADTPRKVVDALRRHLRQHDLDRLIRHDDSQRQLLNLLRSRNGNYSMPQAMLPQVTDACRRHGVPYAVVDKRAMVDCSIIRMRHTLSSSQKTAVRRLFAHDSAVLVAENKLDRLVVAAETIARRKQRALVVTTRDEVRHLTSRFRDLLGLEEPQLSSIREACETTRIVVGSYLQTLREHEQQLRADYGLVVFDKLCSIDPVTLMRIVRGAGARYLLGLAEASARSDKLHGPLFVALGGVAHQLSGPHVGVSTSLRYLARTTEFDFPYGGRSQYQAMLAALAENSARNTQIVNDIVEQAGAGRPCLVLSERRDQVDRLREMLPSALASKAAVLTSSVRQSDRAALISQFDKGKIKILLATSQIACESVRSSRLACLILAFPFSYVRKLDPLVRLLGQPQPYKKEAVVVDYDDACLAPLHRAFEKRKKSLAKLQRSLEQDQLRRAQLKLDLESVETPSA